MKKFFLSILIMVFPLYLTGYEDWSLFLREIYSPSDPYNIWGFVGEMRGGYFFAVNVVYHENESDEVVLIITPSGKKIKKINNSVSPIFDPEKFYYSGENIEIKITGYGLEFATRKPFMKIYGIPDRKFVSPFKNIKYETFTLDLPMWKWRFRGKMKLKHIGYRLKWVRVYHFSGNKWFRKSVFAKSAQWYSIFGIIADDGIFIYHKDDKFFITGGAIIRRKGDLIEIAATEGVKKIFLTFKDNNLLNSGKCNYVSRVNFKLISHPPFYSVPGTGLITCFSENE